MPAIGCLRLQFQVLVLGSSRMSFAQHSNFLGIHLFELPSVSNSKQRRLDLWFRNGCVALCCHNGPSLLFRHNNIRDILGHSARAAGLAAVVIEKKNQIEASRTKPGDITVQQYHWGFATSAFDVTISHPLQKK